MAKDILEGMGNVSKVVGGAGRLVYAPYGQATPTKISDVIDLATFQLKSGYKDFGFTDGGIEMSRAIEVEEVNADQSFTPIDSYVSGASHTLSTSLMENTIENRQIANMGASIVSTPATYGTATTTTALVAVGGTVIPVTSASGITVGSYIDIDGQVRRVVAVNALNVTIDKPLTAQVASAGSVKPITEHATKKISYGSQNERPAMQIVLLSKKRNGAILMVVFHNCKVSGEESAQNFNKETRMLPLSLVAYPEGALDNDSDVYFEMEQDF